MCGRRRADVLVYVGHTSAGRRGNVQFDVVPTEALRRHYVGPTNTIIEIHRGPTSALRRLAYGVLEEVLSDKHRVIVRCAVDEGSQEADCDRLGVPVIGCR